MGAGSSARKKLDVEKKLREDAERKAEAEAQARKKLEDELREARRELESVRSQMERKAGGAPRALADASHASSGAPWKPCRTNKTLADAALALPRWSLSRVIVYHDGENCWVPNHADLRFAAVRDALCRIVAG